MCFPKNSGQADFENWPDAFHCLTFCRALSGLCRLMQKQLTSVNNRHCAYSPWSRAESHFWDADTQLVVLWRYRVSSRSALCARPVDLNCRGSTCYPWLYLIFQTKFSAIVGELNIVVLPLYWISKCGRMHYYRYIIPFSLNFFFSISIPYTRTGSRAWLKQRVGLFMYALTEASLI